jgi:hypothetical protein
MQKRQAKMPRGKGNEKNIIFIRVDAQVEQTVINL